VGGEVTYRFRDDNVSQGSENGNSKNDQLRGGSASDIFVIARTVVRSPAKAPIRSSRDRFDSDRDRDTFDLPLLDETALGVRGVARVVDPRVGAHLAGDQVGVLVDEVGHPIVVDRDADADPGLHVQIELLRIS